MKRFLLALVVLLAMNAAARADMFCYEYLVYTSGGNYYLWMCTCYTGTVNSFCTNGNPVECYRATSAPVETPEECLEKNCDEIRETDAIPTISRMLPAKVEAGHDFLSSLTLPANTVIKTPVGHSSGNATKYNWSPKSGVTIDSEQWVSIERAGTRLILAKLYTASCDKRLAINEHAGAPIEIHHPLRVAHIGFETADVPDATVTPTKIDLARIRRIDDYTFKVQPTANSAWFTVVTRTAVPAP